MSISKGEALLAEVFSEAIKPDPLMLVSEWAERFRVLSNKSSSEPGTWRNSRTPYLVEIMDCLSPSNPTKRVVFMKSSQVGGSEAGFNWLGYIMHLAPGPTLMVQPTSQTAERVSKQRIAPMIEESPVLKDRVADPRSRDSGNTVLMKEFQGGLIIMTGANSAVGLRSMPVKNLFFDELSAAPLDADGEGSPLSLAEKRTDTFTRCKIFLPSTPTIKDVCQIEFEYEKSDKRRYFVPCPKCNEMQYLKWPQVKWDPDKPESAWYECEKCFEKIPERLKTQMLANGKWVATAPSDGMTAGFHISALYSPWKKWGAGVKEFLSSKHDAPQLQVWVNTYLGETFEEDYASKVGANSLMERAEFYCDFTCPPRVLCVTCGIDVQDDRLEMSLYGWGRGEEVWFLHHNVIKGSPALPETWRELEKFLASKIPHEIAEPLKISAAAIDSGGHFTQEVYGFARAMRSKNFLIAIKGQSQKGKPPIGKPTKVDINFKNQSIKHGAEVYPVGSDTIKNTIFGRLKHNKEGEGFIHFHSGCSKDFFDQITSEKQITRFVKGFPVREYVKKSGQRNEALDCLVYAIAALNWLYTKRSRKLIWDHLEAELKLLAKNKEKEPHLEAKQEKTGAPIQTVFNRNTINRKKGGFVSQW